MARNNLNIVVKVVDLATKKLQDINKAIQGVSGQITAASNAMNKGLAGRVNQAANIAKKQHQLIENLNRKAFKEDVNQQLSKAIREKRALKQSVTENNKVLQFKAAMARQRAVEEQKLSKSQENYRRAETSSRLKNFKQLDAEQAKRVENEIKGRAALMSWNTKSAATAQRQADAALGKKADKEQKVLQSNLNLNDKLNQKALQAGDKAKADALAKNQKDQAAAVSTHQKLLDANASNQQKQAKAADMAILQRAKQRDKDAAAAQKTLDQQAKADISQGKKVTQFRQAMAAQRAREEKELAKKNQDTLEPKIDLTKFNRTLFTMAAFVGTFAKLFGSLKSSLEEGADLDRITKQYERTFGESGTLINKIRGFTSTSVDRMEAMQSAIALGNIGVAKNSTEAANIIAQAATAAKLANVPVEEGIKRVTQSFKDGSLASLEFLNAIRTNDPGLKAHMAMLHKVGGSLGSALTASQKYAMIQNILKRVTADHMFAERDLSDVMMDVDQSFKMMRLTIGTLLGKALAPLIESVTMAIDKGTEFIDRLRRGDKELLIFTKNIILLGSTIAGTIALFGTLRLGMMMFKSFGGFGFFGIGAALVGLAMAFSNLEDPMTTIANIAKQVGGVFGGVIQLVSSFFLSSQNYAKGVGKMDKQLAAFLETVKIGDTNLLQLTATIARGAIVVIKFIQDMVKVIDTFASTIMKQIQNIGKALGFLAGDDSAGAWSRKWIDETDNVRNFLVNAASVVALAWGSKKLFGPILGVFGKTGAKAGAMSGFGAAGAGATGMLSKLITPVVTGIGQGFTKLFPALAGSIGSIASKFGFLGGVVGKVAGRIPVLGTAIALLTSLPTILSDEASRKEKFEAGGGAIGGLVGTAIGAALGGPVGAFIGGVIGTFAGQKIGEILSRLFPENGTTEQEPIISWAPVLSSSVQSIVKTVGDWIGNSDSLTEKIVKATAAGVLALSTTILTIPAAITLAMLEGAKQLGEKAYESIKRSLLEDAGAEKLNRFAEKFGSTVSEAGHDLTEAAKKYLGLSETAADKLNTAADKFDDTINGMVQSFTNLPFKMPDVSGPMFTKEGEFVNKGKAMSEREYDSQKGLYNALVHTDIDTDIINSGLVQRLIDSTKSQKDLADDLRQLGVKQDPQIQAIIDLTQELKNLREVTAKQGVANINQIVSDATNPSSYMNTMGLSAFDKQAGFGWDAETGAKTLMNPKIYDPAAGLTAPAPYALPDKQAESNAYQAQLKQLAESAQADQKKVIMAGMDEALKKNAPGEGEIITKAEYEEIYKNALNASAVAKNTKPKTDHKNKTGC